MAKNESIDSQNSNISNKDFLAGHALILVYPEDITGPGPPDNGSNVTLETVAKSNMTAEDHKPITKSGHSIPDTVTSSKLDTWIPIVPPLDNRGSKKTVSQTEWKRVANPVSTLSNHDPSLIGATVLMAYTGYDEYILTPSQDYLQERQDNNNCYVQTCDQTITGRQLAYNRALDIVQNEEYLEAADTDLIRRQFNVVHKRHKQQSI